MAACAASDVAFSRPSEDHVTNAQSRPALREGQQGPSSPDLDVIRMGADRQDRQGPFSRQLETQGKHGPPSALCYPERLRRPGTSDVLSRVADASGPGAPTAPGPRSSTGNRLGGSARRVAPVPSRCPPATSSPCTGTP